MSTTLIVFGVLAAVFLGLIVFSYYKMKNTPEEKKSDNIKVLNAKSFKIHIRGGLVLVDFWAAWCAPCKMLVPVLNDIADNEGDKLSVYKLNVEQYRQVASKQKIKNLPTLILYKNGTEVKRIMGFKSKKAIMKEVMQYV